MKRLSRLAMFSTVVHVITIGALIALVGPGLVSYLRIKKELSPPLPAPTSRLPASVEEAHRIKYGAIDARYKHKDLEALITVRTAKDLPKIRDGLITFLWGHAGLPRNYPETAGDFRDRLVEDIQYAGEVEKLVIRMDHGLTSVALFFHPEGEEEDHVLIYHEGHNRNLSHAKPIVEFFLKNHVPVMTLFMPLMGANSKPTIIHPRLGELRLKMHDQMAFLEAVDAPKSPIRYFITPVVVCTNYLLRRYRNVSVCGISGGGWVANLSGAVDGRLKGCYPAAWGLPACLREPNEVGDYEQSDPKLLEVATYVEQMLLAASGPRRDYMTIHNEFDIFGGRGRVKKLEVLSKALESIGSTGQFAVFLDEGCIAHSVSKRARRMILQRMLRADCGE